MLVGEQTTIANVVAQCQRPDLAKLLADKGLSLDSSLPHGFMKEETRSNNHQIGIVSSRGSTRMIGLLEVNLVPEEKRTGYGNVWEVRAYTAVYDTTNPPSVAVASLAPAVTEYLAVLAEQATDNTYSD